MNREHGAHSALVVDDDEFMLKILARTLESLGYAAIATCASGAEALSRLKRETEWPDIVLCDLNMPEMDGVEFLRKLAEIGYDGAIIVISGEDKRILTTAEALARGHQLHILGHLEKPVTPDQLKTMLARSQLRQEPRARASAEFCTSDEIRAGLAQGQFVPWFQPKVEIATGWAVEAEALARWRHPERGMIAPDCFIPVAEQSGLIRELTWSILTQSLRQTKAWHEQGNNIKVALNVSMADLVRLDFPEELLQLARAAGVKPFSITLEVTESRLSNNPLMPLDILARLRLKRVGLSIDDFGAGYSTLTQLKDFPFDELKVAPSFVRGAVQDPTARAILESAVNLGKKFSMRVVANGVETKEQWDLVAALGCDIAQGNLIAGPMPGPDLPAWIKAWKAP
jgi:EAL domain-containing protein (putative c-di-GMP-specific phosphodiesterase class I)/FixJ family two-component response regulator